jgi:hypothetical protein
MTRREDFHGSVGIEKPIAVWRVGIFTVQDHCNQKAGNQIKNLAGARGSQVKSNPRKSEHASDVTAGEGESQ